jgi:hypothetical protein
MIVRWKVMGITISPIFCWKSTNKGSSSTDMHRCIFHLLSVWYNFCNAFSSKTTCGLPQTTWWSTVDHSFEKHCSIQFMSQESSYHSVCITSIVGKHHFITQESVSCLLVCFCTYTFVELISSTGVWHKMDEMKLIRN